jgi:hypothetical protein
MRKAGEANDCFAEPILASGHAFFDESAKVPMLL